MKRYIGGAIFCAVLLSTSASAALNNIPYADDHIFLQTVTQSVTQQIVIQAMLQRAFFELAQGVARGIIPVQFLHYICPATRTIPFPAPFSACTQCPHTFITEHECKAVVRHHVATCLRPYIEATYALLCSSGIGIKTIAQQAESLETHFNIDLRYLPQLIFDEIVISRMSRSTPGSMHA